MRFSLTELEILAALGRGQTLAHIAKGLGVGQPAISRALHELERKYQMPIVEHGANRLRLNPTVKQQGRRCLIFFIRLRRAGTNWENALEVGAAGNEDKCPGTK